MIRLANFCQNIVQNYNPYNQEIDESRELMEDEE